MPLYNKPTWQLVEDALPDLSDVFTTDDVIRWFRENYPALKEGTIRAHLLGMSVNSPSRHHYKGLIDHGVLYKIDRLRYTRYDSERHGVFDIQTGVQAGIIIDEDEVEPSSDQSEFALELHLEEFMERYWSQINFGRPLEIWADEDDISGRQYHTEVGYIDFLCRDTASNALVVIELKKNKTSDQVVGQCQRYMGWVKRNVAHEGQSVEGLIIAPEVDDKLRYALDMTMNISALCYKVQSELAEPEDTRA